MCGRRGKFEQVGGMFLLDEGSARKLRRRKTNRRLRVFQPLLAQPFPLLLHTLRRESGGWNGSDHNTEDEKIGARPVGTFPPPWGRGLRPSLKDLRPTTGILLAEIRGVGRGPGAWLLIWIVCALNTPERRTDLAEN